MAKQRPSVDPRAYDAAQTLLEISGDKFNALRDDIQVDLIWEFADIIQKAWEVFCEEQKI